MGKGVYKARIIMARLRYIILMVFLCLQILTIDGAAIVALVLELNVVGFLLKISAKK